MQKTEKQPTSLGVDETAWSVKFFAFVKHDAVEYMLWKKENLKVSGTNYR